MNAMQRLRPLLGLTVVLSLGCAAALGEADGPDFYSVGDVAENDVLNMRAGPNANYQIVGTIPPESDGIVNFGCIGELSMAEWEKATESERQSARNRRWCRIGFERIIGWSAGRYLYEGTGPDAFGGGEALTSLAGSEWQLRDFAGTPVKGDAWIAFKSDGGVTGNSGCNSFNTSYIENSGQIELAAIAMTRMACPPPLMELEVDFIEALDGVDGVIARHMVLALFNADGVLLATLTRRDAD